MQIHVKRLPKDTGATGWNEILPKRNDIHALETSHISDWLIIGAGFAGLTAAKRLSELTNNDRITVLDAISIGDGPSGRNSGFMIDLPHDLSSKDYGGALQKDITQTKDNRIAIDYARKMVEEFSIPAEAFQETGKINGAATAKGIAHNKAYSKHLDRMNETYHMLDADDMKTLTGISYYQSGLYTPGTALLQPALYIRGVLQGLRLIGNHISIYENSPIIKLEHINGEWVAHTQKANVTAKKVILAVNGHLENFGFTKNQLMHVFTYGSMTREMNADEISTLGGEKNWNITPADPMGTTVRRISGIGGDRITIRNRFTFDPTLEISEKRLTQIAKDHDRSFYARFPMLKNLKTEYRWGGRLCLSYNNVQFLRELDTNLYSATVQNGLGTVKGTLAGKLVAEFACNQHSPALERILKQDNPSRLPPRPIAKLGATIRLKWGEFKAGKEM